MRRSIIFVLLLAATVAVAAQEHINLGLIPTPQKVEYTYPNNKSRTVDINELYLKVEKVNTLPVEANMDQAYQIIIDKKNFIIRYVDSMGYVNARQTLNQLGNIYDSLDLPCVTITDWPAYRYRGWMDDISRGPVPHEKYRKKQYEVLHALKYNFCNYYTEHTLYQKEFPDLAPAYAADCQPLPDEVINLQLFAHAEKTLRVPFYQHLMDSKTNFNPDDEATYDFLKKRIAAAFERIPSSPFFIINCDETEQLGTGRARRLVDSLGADQVYVNHINRCYNLIKNLSPFTSHLSPRVIMWGDIVAKNPAMMKQLPKDMTYIMWAYEPLDSYDHLIKPFKENGTPFWVAPSLSHSSNMIPNPYRYMKNIANLARDGWRNGAEGLMNTCWDDNGEALFDNCWHGLFWSAEMAWNPIKTDDPEEFARRERQFNENFERLFYGAKDLKDSKDLKDFKVSQLYAVGALESDPDIADWYTSAALMEPLLNFNPDNTNSPALVDRVNAVERLITSIHVDSAANPHVHYAMHHIKATAQKANLRYVIYHGLENYEPYAEEYLQALFNLKREYLRLWDQENGDYERYIVLNRYDELAREVLELDRHVFVEVCSDTRPRQPQAAATPSNFAPLRSQAVSPSEPGREGERNGYGRGNKHTGSSPKVGEGDPSKARGEECAFPMVKLKTLYGDRPIYYTLDGSEPTVSSTLYTGPFPLERSATIKAIAYNKYGEGVITEQYLLSHLAMGSKITLNTRYSDYKAIYSGGGENALIDGQLGSNTTYADGHWQGYWGDSIDAIIEFPTNALTQSRINTITMRFMQNTFDWILAPREIKVYASKDGKQWTLVADKHFDMDPRETGMRLKNYTVPLNSQFSIFNSQFLRVVVPNPGPLPSWHPAPGQPSYLFTDEIIVR